MKLCGIGAQNTQLSYIILYKVIFVTRLTFTTYDRLQYSILIISPQCTKCIFNIILMTANKMLNRF